MIQLTDTQRQALETLAAANGGKLTARQVVEAAADPASPLHGLLTWDDAIAGYRYRLAQARRIIRCHLTSLPTSPRPVKTYHSLASDRVYGAGYTHISDIIASPIKTTEMRQMMLRDLRQVATRYECVPQLKAAVALLRQLIAELDVTPVAVAN